MTRVSGLHCAKFSTLLSLVQSTSVVSREVPYDQLTTEESIGLFCRGICIVCWHHPEVDSCCTTTQLTVDFGNFPLGKPLDGMSGGPFHVEKVDLSY